MARAEIYRVGRDSQLEPRRSEPVDQRAPKLIRRLRDIAHRRTRNRRKISERQGGGTGRRKELKIPRASGLCGFDSLPRHQLPSVICDEGTGIGRAWSQKRVLKIEERCEMETRCSMCLFLCATSRMTPCPPRNPYLAVWRAF